MEKYLIGSINCNSESGPNPDASGTVRFQSFQGAKMDSDSIDGNVWIGWDLHMKRAVRVRSRSFRNRATGPPVAISNPHVVVDRVPDRRPRRAAASGTTAKPAWQARLRARHQPCELAKHSLSNFLTAIG